MPRVREYSIISKTTVPSRVKIEVRRAGGGEKADEALYNILLPIHSAVERLTQLIDMDVVVISQRASQQGITVKPYAKSDQRVGCGTCLGKHNFHYPYFDVKYPRMKRVQLSTRRQREFLAELGFSIDFINEFDAKVQARHVLIYTFNGVIDNLHWTGLTTLTVEGEVEEVKQT